MKTFEQISNKMVRIKSIQLWPGLELSRPVRLCYFTISIFVFGSAFIFSMTASRKREP
jgi:hypothetical protein